MISIDTAHEMLISDICELYERKHYMYCIIIFAQAYEVFFSLYLRVKILFTPFSSDPKHDTETLSQLEEELYNKIKKYGFAEMRALFLQHVVTKCSPTNLMEAEAVLSAFPKPQIPSDAAIRALADAKLVSLLQTVKKTKIHEMRNFVVHKHAYRPVRHEVDLGVQRN